MDCAPGNLRSSADEGRRRRGGHWHLARAFSRIPHRLNMTSVHDENPVSVERVRPGSRQVAPGIQPSRRDETAACTANSTHTERLDQDVDGEKRRAKRQRVDMASFSEPASMNEMSVLCLLSSSHHPCMTCLELHINAIIRCISSLIEGPLPSTPTHPKNTAN